ncbi:hypothetical protein PybrP1_007088 [[Pythium] brassicae (nom. inval.)]|nr:hypothetical protein PybrP1_007088 [[Pythium] brassicae (nom. inval.)]
MLACECAYCCVSRALMESATQEALGRTGATSLLWHSQQTLAPSSGCGGASPLGTPAPQTELSTDPTERFSPPRR